MTRDTARSHDDPPYDRDLIRSGSASRRGERRNEARAPRAAASRASGRARGGRSLLRTIRNVLLLALLAVIVGGVLLGMRAAGTFPMDDLVSTYPAGEINRAVADVTSGAVVKPVLVW